MGATVGPIITANEYAMIVYPRSVGLQMSARTPPVLETGAEPKKPVKNRVMSKVCISFAAPDASEKIPARKTGPSTVHLRPNASESALYMLAAYGTNCGQSLRAQTNGPNLEESSLDLTGI